MRLALHDLYAMHPKLQGHPVDFAKCAAVALQRAGHESPVHTGVEKDGVQDKAEIEWRFANLTLQQVLDRHRVTEDGAEGIALVYVHSEGNWRVKRRLQRSESADWLLLRNENKYLALEVSGAAEGGPRARLREKIEQVSRCTLVAERLAIVIAFDKPTILVAHP